MAHLSLFFFPLVTRPLVLTRYSSSSTMQMAQLNTTRAILSQRASHSVLASSIITPSLPHPNGPQFETFSPILCLKTSSLSQLTSPLPTSMVSSRRYTCNTLEGRAPLHYIKDTLDYKLYLLPSPECSSLHLQMQTMQGILTLVALPLAM